MSNPPPPAHKVLGGNPIRRKRKLVSSGGQKWFKGTPRRNRGNQPTLQPPPPLPVTPASGLGLENPPQLPPALVQFTLEGVEPIKFSVYDQLPLLAKVDEGDGVPQSKKKKKLNREEPLEDVGGGNKINNNNNIVKVEEKPLPNAVFRDIEDYELKDAPPLPNAYIRWMEDVEMGDEVEYHLDEEDSAWLDLINSGRECGSVSLEIMELLMDRLEKESYLQMQSSGLDQRPVIDEDAVCCICMDGECQNSNAILFCDMCNLAVHQECYGVPYIPEGQWLCRRCLQSPSREVECVLCPNKGGAFKQTDDGRWAHVACAIWVPEVCFANTVFLEPIDSVNNIPPARWRLCCFICKYKGRGACIQCHKSNCYTAFHVTCAQHAGLCMRMDTVRIGSQVTVRKTAYCDNHAPPDFIRQHRDGDSPTVRQKLKACRKMLAEKRSAKPTVSVPMIPPDRMTAITSSVTFGRKTQFIKRLLSYWKLKRIQRNGVPLIRRLQAASNHPPSSSHNRPIPRDLKADPNGHPSRFLKKLRNDLERARLLCEMMRQRERRKRDLIAITIKEWIFRTTPYEQFLCSIIDELGTRDPQAIFADPVNPEAVPDYLTVINAPMDLSTMRKRAQEMYYSSVNDLRIDFQLMIDNCFSYNPKDSVFYRTAIRMQEAGRLIFKEAERLEAQIGFEPQSRLHMEEPPTVICAESDEKVFKEMDHFLNDEARDDLPPSQHLSKLEELQDKVIGLENSASRTRRYQRLKKEILKVRRMENSILRTPEESPNPGPEFNTTQQPVAPVSPTAPVSTIRRLRKKSIILDDSGDNGGDTKRERTRRKVSPAVAEPNKTPSRRSSRSTENSPTRGIATPSTRNSQARRVTRLSIDSDRVTRSQQNQNSTSTVTSPLNKTPIANGLMRNGRSNKSTPSVKGRRKQGTASTPTMPYFQPTVDSFSVYRDTDTKSSDGEQDEDEEDDDDINEISDEDDSTSEDDEESESEADYSDVESSTPVPSPRVTREASKVQEEDPLALEDESGSSSDEDSSMDEMEEEVEEEEKRPPLGPRHHVWAKLDNSWYPAVIVDPDHTDDPERNGFFIPVPPDDILAKRPVGRKRKESYLVLFYHSDSTWAWVGEDELQLLGVNPKLDRLFLEKGRSKLVKRAYERAATLVTQMKASVAYPQDS